MITVNTLNELAKEIHQGNVEKGFWDKDRSFAETCMLIVSELSEAVEADRNASYTKFKNEKLKDVFPNGLEDGNIYNIEIFKIRVKDTVEDEIADTFIRLLDLCGRMDIDIESHILLKLQYNKTRPRLHGKTY